MLSSLHGDAFPTISTELGASTFFTFIEMGMRVEACTWATMLHTSKTKYGHYLLPETLNARDQGGTLGRFQRGQSR